MSELSTIVAELAVELATTRQRHQVWRDLSCPNGLPPRLPAPKPGEALVPLAGRQRRNGHTARCLSERTVDVTDLEEPRVSQAGYYWCFKCRRVTELLDSDTGLAGKRCEHCRSQNIEWRAGTPELPHWADPPEPKKAQKLHRLPPEKRNLRLLASEGYWFCNGCNEVTQDDKHGRCILCKSDRIEWHDPVFKEGKAQ